MTPNINRISTLKVFVLFILFIIILTAVALREFLKEKQRNKDMDHNVVRKVSIQVRSK